MSLVTTMKCDGEKCGKLRMNDTNHWLQGVVEDNAVVVSNLTVNLPKDYFSCWGEKIQPENIKHFCGEQCANKWVSQQIGKLKR